MSSTQTHNIPKVGDIVKGYKVSGTKTTKPKRFPGYIMPSRTFLLLEKAGTNNRRVVSFNEQTGQIGDFEKVECGWKKGRRFMGWNEIK